MMNIMKYRLVTKPRIAMDILQSCYRHLWYLVPQTVVMALADQGLDSSQKERMAVKLHSLERNTIVGGKPTFPTLTLVILMTFKILLLLLALSHGLSSICWNLMAVKTG